MPSLTSYWLRAVGGAGAEGWQEAREGGGGFGFPLGSEGEGFAVIGVGLRTFEERAEGLEGEGVRAGQKEGGGEEDLEWCGLHLGPFVTRRAVQGLSRVLCGYRYASGESEWRAHGTADGRFDSADEAAGGIFDPWQPLPAQQGAR